MPQPAVKRAIHRDKIAPLPAATSAWDKAVSAFLAECVRRNLSRSTLQNYEWYLRGTRMAAFIEDHAITSPAQMDKGMLEAFEGELFAAKGDLSAGTVHTFAFRSVSGSRIEPSVQLEVVPFGTQNSGAPLGK